MLNGKSVNVSINCFLPFHHIPFKGVLRRALRAKTVIWSIMLRSELWIWNPGFVKLSGEPPMISRSPLCLVKVRCAPRGIFPHRSGWWISQRLSKAKIHRERLCHLQTSCYSRRKTVTFGPSNTQLDPTQKQQISSYIQAKKLSLSPRK